MPKLAGVAKAYDDLGVAQKVHGVVGLFVFLTLLLLVMAIQSVRLQTTYREDLAVSANAALNIERVNGLIFAIVMESRGIYMSADSIKAKPFGDALLVRNAELGKVLEQWQDGLQQDDAARFAPFKKRIEQFISFRRELVRRAVEVSPAAGREWGDNDVNRALRTALNDDLAALAGIYGERARTVAELGNVTRLAAWYLALLGFGTLVVAGLTVVVMQQCALKPLSEIARATDAIVAGRTELVIPYIERRDELGQLAAAVQKFHGAAVRNEHLEKLSIDTAKQRDEAIQQRDALNDKYYATKWQLSAAINSLPQGMMMLDAAANILVMNEQYRTIYALPPELKPGSSLLDILQYRFKKGQLRSNVSEYLAAIMARIGKRQPSSDEIQLIDGRTIHILERPMDGGGWVATHDDVTEQRRNQRILERTERFLVTVIENIPEAIVAKDARNLRYVFVNTAAEKMFGLPRGEIIGKNARELFPPATAELIEQRDRQLMMQEQQLDPIVDTVESPIVGRRTISVRRLQVGAADGESQLLVSLIEDLTHQARTAA